MDSVWGGQLNSPLRIFSPGVSDHRISSKLSKRKDKPAGDPGQRVTILSIDGVGVGGVILATILQELEAFLQEKDGPKKLPVGNRALAESKYDPQGLEGLLKKHFGEKLSLKDMLKDVIIPSFDIKLLQPIFFSSVLAKQYELDNAELHSVCRATLATPSYFPPAQFKTEDRPEGRGGRGRTKEFNMIDGVVTVSNPTYVAITQAIKDVRSGSMCQERVVNSEYYGDLLVLSLGTGNKVQSFTKDENKENMDLVDLVFNASSDMVDYNLNIMFESQDSSPNYLRITADSLNDSAVSLDDSSPANLDRLVKMGTKLLDNRVAKRHNVTGEPVPASNGKTNRKALKSFAEFLSKERKARLPWIKRTFKNQAPTLQSAPAHNPETAVEEVVESQVEERAYVAFPYRPPQQFFDNPFQTSTHDMSSGNYLDASFTDHAYTGRSNFPESSESSGSWRGDQSTTTTFSDYPDDNCESGQRSYTYSESAYQMSYPEPQSTSLSSQPDQGRYQDYFNIFS